MLDTVLRVGVVAIAFLAIFAIYGRFNETKVSRRIKAAEARADSLEKALASAKINAFAAQYASRESERREREAATKLNAQLQNAQRTADYAKAVYNDSAASTERLRDALYMSAQQIDSLTMQVSTYMATVDTLRDRHAAERRALAVVMSGADSVIAVQKALIATLRADQCRVLGIPCPTRKQAFIAGVVLGAVVALK